MRRWQIWIDRGGTFTDCIGLDPARGELVVAKVLSSDDAPVLGVRTLLGLAPRAPIPPIDLRIGTTLATNALLERRGAPTLFVVTRGLGDLLELGDQTRPDLFALAIRRPAPLPREVLEVDARLDPNGRVIARPDPERLLSELRAARGRGLESVAVLVLHSYVDGGLEREIGVLARQAGFEHVSLSSEVDAELGALARAETTVADAYVAPVLARYVEALGQALPGSSVAFMQSSGGLTDAARFRGRDALLSGPAGGVVGALWVARAEGHEHVIGLDMGGTSTDVFRSDGQVEHVYEGRVAGLRVRAPLMPIHTIAAGGGSVCRFDGRRLTVGPDSAGAMPGPLCYGRPDAHELTLTDVNLALGRILPDRFPLSLERERVDDALGTVARALEASGDSRGAEGAAVGFFRVAVESMAQAIRQVTVARGRDPREHALVVFGGAGGQHACAVARRLGIRTVLVHPLAGALSAWGIGLADVTWHGEADAGRRALGDGAQEHARALAGRLEGEGRASLEREVADGASLEVARKVDLRYRGTELALTLALEPTATLGERFEALHRRELGYARTGHPVEVVAARVEVRSRAPRAVTTARRSDGPSSPPVRVETRLWAGDEWHERAPVHARESLEPGTRIRGPALVLDSLSTLCVDPGFELGVLASGCLELVDRVGPSARTSADAATAADPVELELFLRRFEAIAEQMGAVLRRTALSTNIRERLDFSCAVFDRDGGLVANAPHIPVHLGAMSESVRAILAAHPRLLPGDVFVTNDPAGGGSHLPDITVVTPVHDAQGALAFFAANRGHHADVGGITPGSMPPFSRTLAEEGVVLRALRVVGAGQPQLDVVRAALEAGPHPARRPDENLADLDAQLAANRTGARLLEELVREQGSARVAAYMRHVQDDAAVRVAQAIALLPDGTSELGDSLDDGTPVRARVVVDGDRLVIDFAGTGGVHPGNLNAPRAVTVAAVLYALRALADRPIPLNGGCLRNVELRIEEPSLLAPTPEAAVVAGNVETSQRVVDVLLGALGLAAASQGTMNNLAFGDETFGYYETIAGGAGAGPGFDGADAVHTHMTNTRITDAEVLETRFPVRLLVHARRRGSGGTGRWRGGDGVVREIELLRDLDVSILSERRTRAPFGLAGGGSGARGRNSIDGREVAGKLAVRCAAGTRVRVETPGGGGWGSAG